MFGFNGLNGFFDKADVDRPFLTHNAELLALIAPQLESELTQQLAQKSLSEQVKGIVKNFSRATAGTTVEHADAAASPDCGTREVPAVDGRSTTRTRAIYYLLHSSLELNETAYLLGYEGANSFFRAFHQWEGTSPGEWRAVHAHASAASKWPMVELFFWTK
jgi:AraC-like DNA-binding protein